MITALAEKYNAPVPRYTSYPTAPHFRPVEDADFYSDWLRRLDPSEPLSLYLHVPFCKEMCWYCGCNTKVTRKYDPVADYAAALRREIALIAEQLPDRFTVSHIHWGGGTPSILSAEDFEATMGLLGDLFDYTPNAERAIEIDPRTADPEKIAVLARSGINRASLGIQDFSHKVQAAINRVQSFGLTYQVVKALRANGIEQLNFDLMYGLPHQDVAALRKTIELSHELRPNRIALFGYAHVPWMKSHMKMINEADLPSGSERAEQALVAADCLKELGYVQIGLDHFARPDDPMAIALGMNNLKRNFQGYTTDSAQNLIGLGASSIGMLPQGYVQNVTSVHEYKRAVANKGLPIAKAVAVTEDDRIRRYIIERLMCDLSVDFAEVETRNNLPSGSFQTELEALSILAEDGLLSLKGAKIEITETGRFLVRTICAVFDTYLGKGAGQHSRTI
ncbi:oxygen-independent coproporphyrinogen III oxidase [Sneathiella glossodoripedis]|uniref:oxygen-independent coproporphyrinogen III oxidase n=1 Tax=Sneathiella glossodoripedis TaxID=418853 RepID=UPI0004712611|nr:oxygen-independent coproporphyrinogen III oxidase [Sneathiella glossodoripedis]